MSNTKRLFTWENSHRREFHTGMTFWFCIPLTGWLGHFISRCLKLHFMTIKYTCDSKSQTLRMRYPFQSTGRPISHRNMWSFRVYMIPLRDFVPEWNSRRRTTTGVKSRRGDLRRHDILWWYHVNKFRAMRGSRMQLENHALCQTCEQTLLLAEQLSRQCNGASWFPQCAISIYVLTTNFKLINLKIN